ncbi:MAG: hypothetical protein JWN04_6582 [Myxococcaceae bacterium]|nr:hypothetical protein [Myxococcaceae bacterium]
MPCSPSWRAVARVASSDVDCAGQRTVGQPAPATVTASSNANANGLEPRQRTLMLGRLLAQRSPMGKVVASARDSPRSSLRTAARRKTSERRGPKDRAAPALVHRLAPEPPARTECHGRVRSTRLALDVRLPLGIQETRASGLAEHFASRLCLREAAHGGRAQQRRLASRRGLRRSPQVGARLDAGELALSGCALQARVVQDRHRSVGRLRAGAPHGTAHRVSQHRELRLDRVAEFRVTLARLGDAQWCPPCLINKFL